MNQLHFDLNCPSCKLDRKKEKTIPVFITSIKDHEYEVDEDEWELRIEDDEVCLTPRLHLARIDKVLILNEIEMHLQELRPFRDDD